MRGGHNQQLLPDTSAMMPGITSRRQGRQLWYWKRRRLAYGTRLGTLLLTSMSASVRPHRKISDWTANSIQFLLQVHACPAPFPVPDGHLNLTQSTNVGDVDIKLGESVTYQCLPDHYFEDQPTKTNKTVDVKCGTTGHFHSINWPHCVDGNGY